MGRYSPTVRDDPGGPLDFSPLASALSDLQDNRLRRRQQKLWEDREAEDRRVQGERERVAAEKRANDVRRRGGTPLLSAPIGQPSLRDLTPAQESRVPQSLGGGALRPMLPRSTGGDYRPEGTGRYLEVIDGESYMVDPLQPMRLQDKVRQDTQRATLSSRGRVTRTLLDAIPAYKGVLSKLTDEDIGQVPLSEIDALSKVGMPKPLAARDDIIGQAKALGLDVSGMSPGEAAQRVAMAEKKWETANRPRGADDENRALIRDERKARAKAAFAARQVRAAQALNLDTDQKFFSDNRLWNASSMAEAERLGMTNADYIAARQSYKDSPSTESARAERAAAKASGTDAERMIAEVLRGGAATGPDAPAAPRGGAGPTPSPAQIARANADPQYAEFLRSKGYALP